MDKYVNLSILNLITLTKKTPIERKLKLFNKFIIYFFLILIKLREKKWLVIFEIFLKECQAVFYNQKIFS